MARATFCFFLLTIRSERTFKVQFPEKDLAILPHKTTHVLIRLQSCEAGLV